VAVDHRDGEDELDLLLQGVERLTGDGTDRQHGAKPRSDRGRTAERSRAGDSPPRGTYELQRQLVIGVVRMPRPQQMDARLNRGLSASDGSS
jgi:hypothetical protein